MAISWACVAVNLGLLAVALYLGQTGRKQARAQQ